MSSEIIPFYSNANVFLTGATGFFGKVITQKLLRTCDDIGGIYLLIRPKKGKTSTQRVEELFSDPVFNKLKEKNPEFSKKIHVVEGDCSMQGLGLNQSSRTLLTDKISIVFHCAATLNMDAKMKDAVGTNVRALSELLDLCHEMRYLKSMVYVSTAYSNCIESTIEEKFYDPPIQATTLVKLAEELEESVLERITPDLVSNWPNTYCYTKAIAESMFEQKAKGLPAGLFRPSIVMPTYFDPVPGWTSNLYGPVGVALATGLGVLRIFYCDPENKFDFVPVDLCVNGLLCSAWEIHKKTKNNNPPAQLPVYNYSAGPKRNITWNQYMANCKTYEYPLSNPIWATFLMLTNNKFIYNVLWFFLHIIPGYLLDLYLILSGKTPRLIKAYKKIGKFAKVLEFFTFREWNIVNTNVYVMWDTLNDIDKNLFPFNLDMVTSVKEYMQNTCIGIKLYLMKESLDNAEEERRNYRRLVAIHNAVKYTFLMITIVCCYKLIKLFSYTFYSMLA